MALLRLLALLVAIAVAVALAVEYSDGDPLVAGLVLAVGVLAWLRVRDRERITRLEAAVARMVRTQAQGLPVLDLPAGDGGREPVDTPGEGSGAAPPAVKATPEERRRRRAATSPAMAPPPVPSREWSVDRLPPPLQRAWAFATGGNPLARVAVLVLFVGFGLAIQLLGTGIQLLVLAAVGAGLIALGWRLRSGTPGFGLTLQGGGVAVLYLTVYAAYALYGLIPSLAAIVLMAGVAVVCGGLALAQDAPGLAVLGVTGGFAAPVLAGTPDGNHLLLLSYYALLNLGVLAVSWARGWRSVAVVGFVATFVTGGLWGGLAYTPALYASVQPFVVVSFAIYLALAVRFAVRSARHGAEERALAVDGALVFGLPAATFVLQAGLVEGVVPYGRAWSAAALAAVYLVGAALLRRRPGVRLLADASLAIGLAFATLALPLAFERVVVGAVWVLEGAGLVWVGARQRKGWMRAAGLALQGAAAVVLFGEGVLAPSTTFTAATLTGWIVAVGLGLSAFVLRPRAVVASVGSPHPVPLPGGEGTLSEAGALGSEPEPAGRDWLGFTEAQRERLELVVGRAFLAAALVWWTITATVHTTDLLPERLWLAGLLGTAAASGGLFLALGRALRWRGLEAAALGVVPAGWVLLVGALFADVEPLEAWRGVGWLALAGATVAALAVNREHPLRRSAFVAAVWLAPAVLAYLLGALVDDAAEGAWAMAVVLAVLSAGLVGALALPSRWADARERAASVGGLVVAVGLWLVGSWGSDGAATPFATLPLFNPADLASVAAVLALVAAWRASEAGRVPLAVAAGALGFGTLTAATLRAVAAVTPVAYDLDALWASPTAQAALAVAWTVLALALAVVAVRRASRPLWFFGAGVLALVVAKLFLVDLTQADAFVRVVAFVTVGVLMLVVGYRAPLPPRGEEGTRGEEA
ncbi:DUF2339 domain-containing protein [Rubrivirga sp. IMCC43871]|uniref:DUF2339 domain-containing protein n=1 Tax=Rubrivirga sp. IMCC43871 TaxID=3391575 RepID=UPI00398FB098